MLLRVIPLFLTAASVALLHRGLRARGLVAVEALPLAAGVAVAVLATVSLAATRLQAFDPWVTGTLTAALVGGLGLVLCPRSRGTVVERQAGDDRWPRAAAPLLLLAILAALYALFPIYFLLGGQDPGLYLAFAAHIARTGGLVLDQPALRELSAEFGDAVSLGYPGIYSALAGGLSEDPADLLPQFLHLFPALLANAWHPFGLEGLVRGNALVSVVALAVFHAFARRLAGREVALLATLLLGINPGVIWHARSALSEPLLLLLTFTGLLLLDLALERGSARVAGAAGATLGLGALDRLDGSVLVVVVTGMALAAWARARRAPRATPATGAPPPRAGDRGSTPSWTAAAALLAGYAVTVGVAALDAGASAPLYVQAAWAAGAARGLLGLNAGLLLAAAVALLALWREGPLELPRRARGAAAVALGGGLVAYLAHGWLVRPGGAAEAARAVVELGWYVTPPALLLTPLGIAWAVRRESWPRWAGWTSLAAFSLFVFTVRLLIEAHHPWSARRWIAQVFPAIAFFSAYLLVGLHREARRAAAAAPGRRAPRARRGRSRAARSTAGRPSPGWRRHAPAAAATAAAVFVIAYAVNAFVFAEAYLFRPLLRELVGDYRRVASQRAAGDTGLTWNQHVASVLTYVYDRPTVHVTRYARGMEAFGIVGALPSKRWGGSLQLRQEGSGWVCGTYVAEDERRRPDELVERCYDASPFGVQVLPEAAGDSVHAGPRVLLRAGSSLFRPGAAERDEESRLWTTGEGGWIVRGPDVAIVPGSYVASWSGHFESSTPGQPAARFEVRQAGDPSALALAQLSNPSAGPFRVDLPFALSSEAPVEFPVYAPAETQLRLDEFRLEPAASGEGMERQGDGPAGASPPGGEAGP